MVTPGKIKHSPYLRGLMETIPEGYGDVLGYAACGMSRTATCVDAACRPPGGVTGGDGRPPRPIPRARGTVGGSDG